MFTDHDEPVRFEESAVSEEIAVHPMVAAEEQQLLEQLRTRAPKKRGRFITMPALFAIF